MQNVKSLRYVDAFNLQREGENKNNGDEQKKEMLVKQP